MNVLSLTRTVWPALCPPCWRVTTSKRSANRSTILPFPSSPHWVPKITTLAIAIPLVPRGTAACVAFAFPAGDWTEERGRTLSLSDSTGFPAVSVNPALRRSGTEKPTRYLAVSIIYAGWPNFAKASGTCHGPVHRRCRAWIDARIQAALLGSARSPPAHPPASTPRPNSPPPPLQLRPVTAARPDAVSLQSVAHQIHRDAAPAAVGIGLRIVSEGIGAGSSSLIEVNASDWRCHVFAK